ncbi:isoprenylcysteine carboxylmethyltransferase family protein [Marinilongibacter aquaticus]|uniref:methyltransferase family protein n=1 Tax=Marinilongibacter aquaticus TaxID=2975157 RepID=UPI0021BDE877|nr:isoprenylcysteine carboxylmethyltransferase family protein [Marinilongibacter aquaticus]UBM60482.1 isoprenylcysteine carboxylmethyltransferase family protein [Marinilongibacter aquaticus]
MALQEELKVQGDVLFKYRSYFPLLFLVFTLGAFVYEAAHENSWMSCDGYWYISLAVGIFGLLIRIFTVGFTPKNTSGRNTTGGQLADELNETGTYSMVRHPLYVGNYFMWLAVAMLTADFWFILAFTFLYWVYYERIMYAEEAFLRNKFGQMYLTWAEGRPAFVPKLNGFVVPKYSFSLKKVLKKEKNGIAALFGLFWLFDLIRNSIQAKTFVFLQNQWFWAFVGSVVFYLIFKVLKRYTKVLEDGR